MSAGHITQGIRRYEIDKETNMPSESRPGNYWKVEDGTFLAITPSGDMGWLRLHKVTEHPDGTITVEPSILVSDTVKTLWHGYLERGVWREV